MDERIRKILTHKATLPTAAGVVSFGVGFGIGYILKKRKTVELDVVPEPREIEYLEDLEVDIPADTTIIDRQIDRTSAAVEEFITRRDGTKDSEDVVRQPSDDKFVIEVESPKEEAPQPVPQNVFARNGVEWDYEEEVKKRTETEPYILHQDEFFQNEKGYTQMTLTYYVGDDMMADQDDQLVYNYHEKTGDLQFGKGAGSPDVFYVRNDTFRAEYEILRHEGHYSVEVQGLEMEEAVEHELRHSGVDKFRD